MTPSKPLATLVANASAPEATPYLQQIRHTLVSREVENLHSMLWLVPSLGHAAFVLVFLVQSSGRKTFSDTTCELGETVREAEYGLLHKTRRSLDGG